MLARMLGLGAMIGAISVAQARADIMHWYWQVEVNGQAADADRPIVVGAGDEVGIELWAEYEPYRGGFAGSIFAIELGNEFLALGDISIDEFLGLGRNDQMRLVDRPGTLTDIDGDGSPDTIDSIEVFQFPQAFNAGGDWRNPVRIYSLQWNLVTTSESFVYVNRIATSNGELVSSVYSDRFGTEVITYDDSVQSIVFVPSTWSMVPLLAGASRLVQRRRSGTRNA